ncbi:MAG TPA: DUF3311 domain-containing protein [Steroidobacteraceae bacterium]|nr:DUF3311 domain-containing protein [Steroidobacteraceae bacterium]
MSNTTPVAADSVAATPAPEIPLRASRPHRLRWWYLLFLVQFVAVLWPPFYNRADPWWLGIPFFYWYQLLWVVLGGLCTAVVYLATRHSP